MNILAVGDVCGSAGCEKLLHTLPKLKKEKRVDFTVINGENSADGNGISPASAEMLLALGADVITGGNHTMRRRELHPLLDENERLLRPHNLTDAGYGSGYCLVDTGRYAVAVLNLIGCINMARSEASNPFLAADELIERARRDGASIILLDFHAETTSEKRAMGFYLDGKVSAVWGTHTHVQTNDAQVLENGTAYMTDLGMTGPLRSVLGVEPSIIIDRLRDNNMQKFERAGGSCGLQGLFLSVNEKTGKADKVEIINIA